LPICSDGGFPGDARVLYDPRTKRYFINALWVYQGHPLPGTNVLAVSASSDPRQKWYVYQYPGCGKNDLKDSGDQPHLGFSAYWIASNNDCSGDSLHGYSLQLFHKADLEAGLSLCGPNGGDGCQTNWWEFQDPMFNGDGRADQPVATYSPLSSNILYFTASAATNGSFGIAQTIYSFIDGDARHPRPHWNQTTITVSNQNVTNGLTNVDTPTCTVCMGAVTWNWIHSSSVIKLPDRQLWLLSSEVWQPNPHITSTNEAMYLMTRLSDMRSVVAVVRNPGVGILGAEITASPTAPHDKVYLIRALSSNSFYPGMAYSVFNPITQRIESTTYTQGTLTPSNPFTLSRWIDFISGSMLIQCIKGLSSFRESSLIPLGPMRAI
jgi:hypothetical protein